MYAHAISVRGVAWVDGHRFVLVRACFSAAYKLHEAYDNHGFLFHCVSVPETAPIVS